MITSPDLLNIFNSPVRSITAKVELYNGSTLTNTFLHTDKLKSFTIEKIGEEKFFGFGICQKLNTKLIDTKKELTITTANSFLPFYTYKTGINNNSVSLTPKFFVSEVHRDENSGELSVTAYDALYKAKDHTFSELTLNTSYTILDVALACATLLGLSGIRRENPTGFSFVTEYPEGANFEGTESIRDVLNAIAEATQTIYYINYNNQLVFKSLNKNGEAVFIIDKEKYFTLESGTNRRLAAITCATELGNNITASLEESGTNQYVRDNPFWDLREDIDTLLDTAINEVGGITINQFECSWRGCGLLEVGDKIGLVTKNDEVVTSYLLNDTITYDGTYSEKTEWHYGDTEEESHSNSSKLGETLKQTYAKVDKVNKQIEIVASETDSNSSAIASLQINTESITTSVRQTQTNLEEGLNGLNESVTELESKVNQTASDLTIEFTEKINSIDSVTTSTGFTFNEEGLTVSKSDSEMTTQITEDGMIVKRDEQEVLIANNEGVKAEDLHATTYLIIGANSRFEDYGSNRTGCFWIG